MYAVTIDALNSIVFLEEGPGEGPWTVQEGAELDIPSNIARHPGGGPPEPVLGVSTTDPDHFKLFVDTRDVVPSGFRPSGRRFGGLFSRRVWERFKAILPGHLEVLDGPDTDPPGAFEEAMRHIRESHTP
jgi:hypothetical protein